MIDRTQFSYSDISSYLRCPRSEYYKLTGVEEQDNPAMAAGRVVHRVHEYMVIEGSTPVDIADVLGAMEEMLDQEPIDAREDEKTAKTLAKLREEGVPWLLRHVQEREYIAQEAQFAAEVPGLPGITLSGHPDSLYRHRGRFYLGDLKSGRNKPRDVRTDLQLNIYAWLTGQAAEATPDRIEITHIYSCEVFEAELDIDLQAQLVDTLVRPALVGILEGQFPANPAHPFGCGYCMYSHACPWGID